MAVRRKFIRSLVEQILNDNAILCPPINVEALAMRHGAHIRYEPAEDDLSGFLFRDHANGLSIIGVNRNHSPKRRRFTVAHELGHLLLHEDESVHIDRVGYAYRFRRQRDAPEIEADQDETEANLFAAELLMPAHFIEQDMAGFPSPDFLDDEEHNYLTPLAERYGVSTQALTFRLHHLGYIQL